MYATYADGNMTRQLAIPTTVSLPALFLRISPKILNVLSAELAKTASPRLNNVKAKRRRICRLYSLSPTKKGFIF